MKIKNKIFYRFGIQRRADKKFYKNPAAIYLNIEDYWSEDCTQLRLWKKKSDLAWLPKKYKIVSFKIEKI